MKRKLKLTITKIRRATNAENKAVFQMPCAVCGFEVEMLTAVESIGILEINQSVFDDLIKTGKIHAVLTASGSLRVCKNSLFQ